MSGIGLDGRGASGNRAQDRAKIASEIKKNKKNPQRINDYLQERSGMSFGGVLGSKKSSQGGFR